MNAKFVMLLVIATLILPVISQAVTTENFRARTTQDLVSLCGSPATDPLHKEAVHFCEGYMVGAYSYYDAENCGPGGSHSVCLSTPVPSRDKVVAMFVQWANAHPQYMGEKPVDTLFRFLDATYPCKG